MGEIDAGVIILCTKIKKERSITNHAVVGTTKFNWLDNLVTAGTLDGRRAKGRERDIDLDGVTALHNLIQEQRTDSKLQ